MVYFLTDYYNSFKHKELETSHLIFIIRLKGTDYLLLLHTNSGLFDVEAYIEPTRTSRMSFYFMAESIFRKKIMFLLFSFGLLCKTCKCTNRKVLKVILSLVFTIYNAVCTVIFKALKPLVYSDAIHLKNPCKLERLLLKDLKIEKCASCPIASNGKFYSQK